MPEIRPTIAWALLCCLLCLLAAGVADAKVLGGTDLDDEMVGTSGKDKMSGGKGRDSLRGLQGNDRIYGGIGNDSGVRDGQIDLGLFGGKGNDELRGRGGSDRLSGDMGEDLLRGGNGDDTIVGVEENGAQSDIIFCGDGQDTVFTDKIDDVDKVSCETIKSNLLR